MRRAGPDSARARADQRAAAGALLLDAALIVGFAAVGRRTHAGAGALTATLAVAWPFLVGWAAAATPAGLLRRPTAVRPAFRAWAVGVPLGLVLRAATGGGVAPAFVVVALLTNLVTLVGWRLLVGRLGRRGVVTSTPTAPQPRRRS